MTPEYFFFSGTLSDPDKIKFSSSEMVVITYYAQEID